MFSFMGRILNKLLNRKLISTEEFREDLRKIGIVLFGSGFLAVILNLNYFGVLPALAGILLMYLGLTKSK